MKPRQPISEQTQNPTKFKKMKMSYILIHKIEKIDHIFIHKEKERNRKK